jgi:hypothetical protein
MVESEPGRRMTDERERTILEARSERGKVALPHDRSMRHPGDDEAVTALCRKRYLVLLDRTVLPQLADEGRPDLAGIVFDIYLVTRAGLQWLETLAKDRAHDGA